MPNREQIQKRWKEIRDALDGAADLRVWPDSQDIADNEGGLLTELDEVEYQLGRDYPDQA